MRAFQVTQHGEAPAFVDIPQPGATPGHLVIRVRACALNFADTLMIKGTYQDTPPLPFTLGLELAGEVVESGSADFPVGARVAAYAGQGGLAEFASVPATRCLTIPDGMSFDEAAAFLIAYGTSHLALARRARLAKGETLLVTGAAGGVGLTAVEIGARMGATVIACARGADKLETAKAAGATHLIDSEDGDLREQVKALGGADVFYDTVGGTLLTEGVRALNPEGRALLIGFASGDVPQIKLNHLLVKNIDLIGVNWGAYARFAPEIMAASLSELTDWHAKGWLRPHIGARFPLNQAAEALEMLRARKSTGKIVVTS